MLCTACGTAFEEKREQAGPRFCSDKCRAAFWRKGRTQAKDERERKVRDLLEAALEALGEGEDLA